MKLINLYTLEEALHIDGLGVGNIGNYINRTGSNVMSLSSLLSRLNISYTPSSEESDLFYEIYNKYSNSYCIEAESLSTDKLRRFVVKLLNVMNDTKDKYIALMGLYNSQKTHLLDAIKSTTRTTSKFNDTPQDEGDFSDDSHTSNITIGEGESSTEATTPIERLNEISRKYENIVENWLKEFAILFIENMED